MSLKRMAKFDEVLIGEDRSNLPFYLHKNAGVSIYDLPLTSRTFNLATGTLVTTVPDFAFTLKDNTVTIGLRNTENVKYVGGGVYALTRSTSAQFMYIR